MRRTCALFFLSILFSLAAAAPAMTSAQTIDLVEVSPAVDEDITPPDDSKGEEENFYTFWFKGQIDMEYTAEFEVSEEPAFTFVSGGDMTLEENVAYDADAGTFTVHYTAKKLEQIDSQSGLELEEGQTLTIIAVSFPAEEGEEGPGENTIGAWIATAFQEWTLITPTEENNAMGATVSGDAEDSGRFKMFMPTAALNVMAEYDGEEDGEYATRDFGIFEEGNQVSAKIKAVDGGAYVDFETTIPEESEEGDGSGEGEEGDEEGEGQEFQSASGGPGSSQEVTVAPRLPVSMSAVKSTVKEGKMIQLVGWIKSAQKGKQVVLQRRTQGDETYRRVKTVRTKKGGKFVFRVKAKESSAFRAKFKKATSDPVRVSVE